MNLWQKPMSSYKENFFLGVCPFLQIRAEYNGRVKNASDQKTDETFYYKTFKN